MNESGLHNSNITPEWQRVVDYFMALDEDWKKEIYLKNLTPDQKDYLLTLVNQIQLNPTQLDPVESTFEMEEFSKKPEKKSLFTLPETSDLTKVILKYSFVGVLSFLLVAVILNSSAVYNWASQLPLIRNVLGVKDAKVVAADKKKEFENWIANYATGEFDKSPEADPDEDALTNWEEFQLKTTPADADTNKNNKLDGQDLLDGIHPLDAKIINYSDKSVLAEYEAIVTRQVLNFRLQALALKNRNLKLNEGSIEVVKRDENGNPIKEEKPDFEVVDTSTPALLFIPKIDKKEIPIQWGSKGTEDEFQKLLESGVVHYPGTSMPGDTGNSYISGHSSDFNFKPGNFKDTFARLDELEPDDKIEVITTMKDGSKRKLIYSVTGKNIYTATDQKQFEGKTRAEVSLSTCWPVGTSEKRLVVKTALVNQELLK
jgi:LPXTG-site transpeptidase (sortase) family protein